MVNHAALARYKTVQVTTSSPGELMMMLWDGLFRFLMEAEMTMRSKNLGRAGECIGRAHAILEEFCTTLDPQYDAALCDNLRGLYMFCMQHLTNANIKRDAGGIADVIRILAPLREAFREAVKQVSQK